MTNEHLKYVIGEELNIYLNFNNSHIGQLRFRLYSTGSEGPTEAFNHADNIIRFLLKGENPKDSVRVAVLLERNLDRSDQDNDGGLAG